MRFHLPSAVAVVLFASPGAAATLQTAEDTSFVMPPLEAAPPIGASLADELIFDAPETPPITDPPAPSCAADGPGCPQFVPPPVGQVPLPPAIFALLAGLAALLGLRRRPGPA